MSDSKTSNEILTRVKRDVYKDLQFIKIDTGSKTLSDTIKVLVEAYKKAGEER